jgi:hypothetical protein
LDIGDWYGNPRSNKLKQQTLKQNKHYENLLFYCCSTQQHFIEVNAENFEDAQEIVMNKVHEGGYLTDLCNPSDMEIEVDIDGEKNATNQPIQIW